LADAVAQARRQGGGRLELWIEQVDDALDAAATDAGFEQWRDLFQMRCPLPVPGDRSPDFAVRPFTPADAEAFLAVNNRAFSWHPEQGNMTLDGLHERLAEPWFDPAGFLLHERDGRLAGFCWTKVHAPDAALGDPAMGEIYAIAIDPDFHGQGLGGPMTLAGLDWLAQQGLEVGMLYVESDNHAAVRTYERLGFTVHHIDRAYAMNVAQ
jgi:mycothiol synthase